MSDTSVTVIYHGMSLTVLYMTTQILGLVQVLKTKWWRYSSFMSLNISSL